MGKKPSSSRKIIPDFYRMHFLPASEPKHPRVANNLLPEEREPNHPNEAYYLHPMSQTHLPVCEAATNCPLLSLGNLVYGSSLVRFESAMAFPKQRPQPPVSKIIGSALSPRTLHRRTRECWRLGIVCAKLMPCKFSKNISTTMFGPNRVRLLYKTTVNPFVGWFGNNSRRTSCGLRGPLHQHINEVANDFA
jgi:hypothetical protein